MQDEIRKMKAMIVKHEKRIRVLEARAGEDHVSIGDSRPPLPVSEPPPVITVNNNNSSGSHPPDQDMAPDEV